MDRKSDKPKSRSGEEIVVFSVVRASQCTECGEELWKGSLLRLEGEKALCMGCADLDRLEFLPAGEAAVTHGPANTRSSASSGMPIPTTTSCWLGTRIATWHGRESGPRFRQSSTSGNGLAGPNKTMVDPHIRTADPGRSP